MRQIWLLVRGVNPQPWAVGPLGVRRVGGKMIPFMGRNQRLVAYKAAIQEEVKPLPVLFSSDVELDVYIWRRLDTVDLASGKKQRADNYADGTNLLKAFEDALQGHVFENDRCVKRGRVTIVKQGPDVTPLIAVRVRNWVGVDPSEIPEDIWSQIDNQQELPYEGDSYTHSFELNDEAAIGAQRSQVTDPTDFF